jgi:hypothetical protein
MSLSILHLNVYEVQFTIQKVTRKCLTILIFRRWRNWYFDKFPAACVSHLSQAGIHVTGASKSRRYSSHYGDRLRTHPNHLGCLTTEAFAGFCLLICLTDSNELFFVVILVLSYLLVRLKYVSVFWWRHFLLDT